MSLCKLCKCPGCAVRGSEYDFASCPSYEPMTHADRIRAKSDEELAEFLGTLPCCPPGEDLEELCFPLDPCEGIEMKVKCWLKWLRQEADT